MGIEISVCIGEERYEHARGIRTTLEYVLDRLVDVNVNRNVADVVNYIRATEFALRRRSELPLCSRLNTMTV